MNSPVVGSRLLQQTCSFIVWAPFRKQVEVVFDETDLVHPMKKDEMGYWHTDVVGVVPGTRYFFRLDRNKKLPDPASRSQPEGVHGPSMVIPEEYPWEDNKWRGLPMSEMIIHEIHVGAFTASRDFKGVISKLPYLKKLGITALELMPVAQFPGDRNWGYDGVCPFAVQNSYGGVQGLKELVNAAHLAGIAVILDVVYNHQGPEGNYLAEYGPYFTQKYRTGWGQAINFDDAWCDGVRNFYWQNALMWLDEFRLDGLRLDAVHAISDSGAIHFIEGLSELVRALEKKTGCKKVLIAEFDLNNPRYVLPNDRGGYALDGQWIDEFHHALHSLLTGEVDGYYEDFGKTGHLARALRDSYVYTGQYSVHRKKLFGRQPVGTTYDQFVVFSQNHDQIGNRMLGDRLTTLVSKEALKLAAVATLLSPHVPLLFMGEEYGEKNPFQYFISHTDKKLVELVRKGRKDEFAHFNWEGEVPDPQAEETFERCMLSWSVEHSPESQELFALYQWLISFRKNRIALKGNSRDTLNIISASDALVVFERKFQNDHIVIVLHFNEEHTTYKIPLNQKLTKIFDSASSQWGGPLKTLDQVATLDEPVTLYPQSALIFEP